MTVTSRDLRDEAEEPAPVLREVPTALRRKGAPLRHWARLAAVGDLAVAVLAAALAAFIRFGTDLGSTPTISYRTLGILVALTWPSLLAVCGAYELRTSLFAVEELRRVLRTGVLLLAVLGMAHFVFRLDLSRGYVGALAPLLVGLTGLWRLALRSHILRWMRRGQNHHKAVAVGPAADIVKLYAQLGRGGRSPIDVVAFVADDLHDDQPAPGALSHLRRLPSTDAIGDLGSLGVPVDLLVRAGRPGTDEMTVLSQLAHRLGITVAIAPDQGDSTSNVAVSYVPLGATPLLVVETPTLRPAAAALKSGLDRIMALVLLVLLSPLIFGLAIVIALREGRPILFTQERVGRDGRLFRCIKFRTMHPGAEHQLTALLDRNEAALPLFKMRDDPRVTPTGRWMRRHSLDELPQLVNVVRGEMSIVGPRPALPSEVATFDQRTARRLLVKPGITGLWQIEGRSNLPWDEGVYLDLMYVDHWSPLLDWVIMARTVKTILRPAGAY